jgi:hypothetical protein
MKLLQNTEASNVLDNDKDKTFLKTSDKDSVQYIHALKALSICFNSQWDKFNL